MTRTILFSLLALLICQTSNAQSLTVSINFNLSPSSWSLTGGSVAIPKLNASDLLAVLLPAPSAKLKISNLFSIMLQNPKVGSLTTTTSKFTTSISPIVTAMKALSNSSTMSTLSSSLSDQTTTLASSAGSNLVFLLLWIETSLVGKTVDGTSETSYPIPQNLSTVGLQAQAVIQFSANLSSEIANYCQQISDLAQSVNATCPTCPTNETCQQVVNKWQNISVIIQAFVNSTSTGSTLVKTLNVTVQGTLLDVINSTNILIRDVIECAKCLNTGFTKNQAVTFKPCSRRRDPSMADYCKKKASESGKRRTRNIIRGRRDKNRRSSQRQDGIMSKNLEFWRGAWTGTKKMSNNMKSNAIGERFMSLVVKDSMLDYASKFGNFIESSGNLTEKAILDLTEGFSTAKQYSNDIIGNVSEKFNQDVDVFVNQVVTDNVETCLSYADDARKLQMEFQDVISKCDDVVDEVQLQILLNITSIFTDWIAKINAWSDCHDRCLGLYCSFLKFNKQTSFKICFLLKRLLPKRYETLWVVNDYLNCTKECSTDTITSISTLNETAQALSDSYKAAIKEALTQVQICAMQTLMQYSMKLMGIKQQYEACVAATITTQETTTETSTSTTETTSTVASSCGTFAPYDAVNNPTGPTSDGFVGGVTLEGFDAYVGRGTVDCNGQNLFPGSVVTDSQAYKGAGLYVACSSEQVSTTGEYLLADSGLAYVPVNGTDLNSIQNTLKVQAADGSNIFYGRVLVNGKYYLGYVSGSVLYYQHFSGFKNATVFEVLACNPEIITTTSLGTTESTSSTDTTTTNTDSTTTGPTESTTSTVTTSTVVTTTTTLEPCGTYVRYDPVNAPNDPVTKGFVAGFDLQNQTAYAGIGNVSCNSQNPLPGGIVLTPVAPKKIGIFISCVSGEMFSNSTALYLKNHPDLEYVPCNSTQLGRIQGAIRVYSTMNVFGHGRVMYGGRYLLGKIRANDATGSSSTMFFMTPGGQIETPTYEVLRCKPRV